MMILRLLLFISIFSLVLLTKPAFALGKLGHQLVCQLAYEQLPLKKQQKLDQLLAALPIKTIERINQYNRQAKTTKITFSASCNWADAIKKDDRFNRFKPWHYINVHREHLKIPEQTCKKGCITAAIEYHLAKLSNDTHLTNKVQALMFLGHWLGDIHQPLHVSYASDYGGNKNKVTPLVGQCDNLHWYWDECLLYPINKNHMKSNEKKNKKNSTFNYIKFNKALYQQLHSALAIAPKELWLASEISDWGNESLTLIREQRFNYCDLNESTCLTKQHQKIMITEAYHQHYQVVLHQRILQAAVRLSSLLRETL
ncbi:S1/P1 nuclease [Colwelliaceae bacterium 6441]